MMMVSPGQLARASEGSPGGAGHGGHEGGQQWRPVLASLQGAVIELLITLGLGIRRSDQS